MPTAVSTTRAQVGISCDEGGRLRSVIRHKADKDFVNLGRFAPRVGVGGEAGKASRFPFVKYVRAATDGGCEIPFGVIERALRIINRPQNVGRQNPLP